jgi:hypothetical protein
VRIGSSPVAFGGIGDILSIVKSQLSPYFFILFSITYIIFGGIGGIKSNRRYVRDFSLKTFSHAHRGRANTANVAKTHLGR